jgi:phage terminase small subunit
MKSECEGGFEPNFAGLQASNSSGPKKKFPPKRALFVKEYLVDFNGAQAAIRAGYAPKTARMTANKLLTFAYIQETIRVQIENRSKRTEITADGVLKNLKEVAERCMEAVPVLDKEGNPLGAYRFEPHGANRALELLGKHLGLFTDKIISNVTLDIDSILRDLSGSTRGLPSMMPCNQKRQAKGGGDDE